MTRTSPSLLERLRDTDDRNSWSRFSDLYVPLLYYWARKLGVPSGEAADLVQDVLIVLVRQLPHFAYDPSRSFRAWLRRVLINRWHALCRRPPMAPLASDVPGRPPPDFDDLDECEYRRHLVTQALRHLRGEFSETFYKAFLAHAVHGRSAEDVAAELGIAAGTVYVAKSRILKRLREELAGLLD
jgi:RNA polymerase sigma-70 factor (ECF subfamily)